MEQQWRDFWDERYAQDGAFFGEAPLAFLKDNLSLFPKQGKILLPADGDGPHADRRAPVILRHPPVQSNL